MAMIKKVKKSFLGRRWMEGMNASDVAVINFYPIPYSSMLNRYRKVPACSYPLILVPHYFK